MNLPGRRTYTTIRQRDEEYYKSAWTYVECIQDTGSHHMLSSFRIFCN